jgi:hypothetical protein
MHPWRVGELAIQAKPLRGPLSGMGSDPLPNPAHYREKRGGLTSFRTASEYRLMNRELHPLETDPRFPSGNWTGYFLEPLVPGRHRMELILTFCHGKLTGEGRDRVGQFILRGRYCLEDGKCHWTKRYLAKHDVFYKGYNEGKGIWGLWEIPDSPSSLNQRGGFHIWPEGMTDPSQSHLTEEADLPLGVSTEEGEPSEPVVMPAAY